MARRMASRLRLLPILAALPLLVWLLVPMVSSGASTSTLRHRIERKQQEIARHKGRERVLTSDIAGFTQRIDSLEGDIGVLERRQVRLQADLDAKRAELERIQSQLRAERLHLARL